MSENLKTVINDFAGEPIVGRMIVTGPEQLAPKVATIPSGASHVFTFGTIKVKLVIEFEGVQKEVPLKDGNEVFYASQVFPVNN